MDEQKADIGITTSDAQKAEPSNEEWLQRFGILLGEYGEAVSFDAPADVERAANAVYDHARALLSKYAAPVNEQDAQAAEVCAELYQVIGSLASDLGVLEHPQVIKVLDNASEHAMVHTDVLPFPSFESPVNDSKRIAELEAEVAALKAARIAYASDFPLNEDGEPDIGNIHANIRALKKANEQDAKDAQRYWWLLKQAWFQSAFDRFDPQDNGLQDRFECECARIIDAAIAQQGKEGE